MLESHLLSHIYARSQGLAAADPAIVVGPGDDCAVVRAGDGSMLLLKVDQLVEWRHFAPGTPIDLIARKAVARPVSDIAAMAGRPRWGLAAAALPAGYPHANELFDALAKWALHFGCPLVGGDIATSSSKREQPGGLSLTVTIVGEPLAGAGAEPRPILRSAARVGDSLYITGTIGAGPRGGLASPAARHLNFEPRLRESAALLAALGPNLHAMMDVSDGLGIDAGRLATASGVRIEIDPGLIPITPGTPDWRAAIADGEDYELLFAAAGAVPGSVGGTAVTRIGRVVAGGAGTAVAVGEATGGRPIDISRLGWDHGADGHGEPSRA